MNVYSRLCLVAGQCDHIHWDDCTCEDLFELDEMVHALQNEAVLLVYFSSPFLFFVSVSFCVSSHNFSLILRVIIVLKTKVMRKWMMRNHIIWLASNFPQTSFRINFAPKQFLFFNWGLLLGFLNKNKISSLHHDVVFLFF